MSEQVSRTGGETATVEIHELKFNLSPRLQGHDADHVSVLLDALDAVPPVLVHRPSMEVVDGVHRTLAAKRAGRTIIRVTFFDGTLEEARVEAIRSNITHGLPLSSEERRLAAASLLDSHPTWSDRRVAAICGVSPTAVGDLRRSTAASEQSNTRLGRDGRCRPLDPAARRQRVAAELTAHPEHSLRQVATKIGVSPATVLDVRTRLTNGEDPVPAKLRGSPRIPRAPQAPRTTAADGARPDWSADPAFAANGAAEFAAWLEATRVVDADYTEFVEAIPVSRLYELIDEARRRAATWRAFADTLEQRVRARH